MPVCGGDTCKSMLQGPSLSEHDILAAALQEDLGDAGDITTACVFAPDAHAGAIIKSKEAGILSGAGLIAPLFGIIDSRCVVETALANGAPLAAGSIIARLAGPLGAILAGERTMLNLLQHLSGIATATAHLVSLIKHTHARLLDTRKTTPLLRLFEKQAVVHGGGCNHRFGLFDMVLIKDTHAKAAGGVAPAICAARTKYPAGSTIKIEAEVQSIGEFNAAIAQKPDRIMLDNMSIPAMRECVEIRNRKASAMELEASGGISAKTIAAVAGTGVDFISSGAITHSAQALDIHLVIV
jgi:nicotinate-nucleotide pyrophosphorylase (carboxylating)